MGVVVKCRNDPKGLTSDICVDVTSDVPAGGHKSEKVKLVFLAWQNI